ncbi:hypothetical protein V6N13_129732 [Hibiscus sabdariffa]
MPGRYYSWELVENIAWSIGNGEGQLVTGAWSNISLGCSWFCHQQKSQDTKFVGAWRRYIPLDRSFDQLISSIALKES